MKQDAALRRLRIIRWVHIVFVLSFIAYFIYASVTADPSLRDYNPDVAPTIWTYVGLLALLYFVPALLVGIILASALIGRLQWVDAISQAKRKTMVIGLAVYAVIATLIGKVVMDFGRIDCTDGCVASVPSYAANTAVALANGLLCLLVAAWLYWAVSPATKASVSHKPSTPDF